MKPNLQFTLNPAFDDLSEIAAALKLSNEQVLLKALEFMKLYSNLKAKEKQTEQKGAILLQEGDQIRELQIV